MKRAIGRKINYKKPIDIRDKLCWLARYWQHPLVVQCTDKYLMRDYIIQCGCEEILTKLYPDNCIQKKEENGKSLININLDSLPGNFFIKCNHGCGYNIIVRDNLTKEQENYIPGGRNHKLIFKRENLDKEEINRILNIWLKEKYGNRACEYHYDQIQPRILIEEYIPDTKVEISVFCFNGEPESFLIRNDIYTERDDAFIMSYSINWNRVLYRKDDDNNKAYPKLHNYEKIIRYSKILSKPFPFVRLDFYEDGERLIFGEFTFTPTANQFHNYRDEIIFYWGQKLKLPDKLSENIW